MCLLLKRLTLFLISCFLMTQLSITVLIEMTFIHYLNWLLKIHFSRLITNFLSRLMVWLWAVLSDPYLRIFFYRILNRSGSRIRPSNPFFTEGMLTTHCGYFRPIPICRYL